MTYRVYLSVLVAVVAIAQLTASMQRSSAAREAAAVQAAVAAARPAPVERVTEAPTALAGGIARPALAALHPASLDAPMAEAPTLSAPVPDATELRPTLHDAPCDPMVTATCVAPAEGSGVEGFSGSEVGGSNPSTP